MTEMELEIVPKVPSGALAKCQKETMLDSDGNMLYTTLCQTTQKVEMNGEAETFVVLMSLATGGQGESSYLEFKAVVYSYEDMFSPKASMAINCTKSNTGEHCESSENLESLHERGLNLYLAVMPESKDELDVGVVEFKLKKR